MPFTCQRCNALGPVGYFSSCMQANSNPHHLNNCRYSKITTIYDGNHSTISCELE
uniref:Uncharacterized protein MANES_13G016400 n=1 Tax=Rhizophora mucronata TaxID=61149 RepID=A0A2P2JE69_RHIMU